MNIIRKPDKIQLVSQHKTKFIEQQTDVTVEFKIENEAMSVFAAAKTTELSYIKLRWYGEVKNNTKIFGDAIERAYGNLEFKGISPERIMAWYCIENYNDTNTGDGVKVRPNTFCFWQIDQNGITLWLDMRCGSSDYCLNGQALQLATIVSMQSNKPVFQFMKDFCTLMSDNPLTVKEPVYGSNNWYYAYGNSSEEEILGDTALIAELTKDLKNRPFMVIDDGWQLGSTSGQCTGTLGCLSNYKFNNMKALADKMKEQNVKPGLWLRLLKFNPENQIENLSLEREKIYIDSSLDESLKLIANDVKKVTGEWGYQLIKYDFATFDIFGKFHANIGIDITSGNWSLKNKMTNAQCIKRFYKTVYDNSNGAVIIGCNCISHLGSGYFHIHRSGDDTSGLVWERTRYYGVNTLAFRLPQHKAFFEVDADCVGILEHNIDWELNKQWLDLLANSGTPLFVSAQQKMVTGEIKAALISAFKKASEQKSVCYPEDILYTTCPQAWNIDGKQKLYNFIDTMGVDKFNT